jgi:hypothetical protein
MIRAKISTKHSFESPHSNSPARKKLKIKLVPLLQHLRNQNKILRSELLFLSLVGHQTMLTGVSGEAIIANAIAGQMTPYGACYDVRKNDVRIEVKTSRLRKHSRFSLALRWSWNKILGENGQKTYDYLVLVGVKDPRYAPWYKDKLGEHVYFCIPRTEVHNFAVRSGRHLMIQLSSRSLGRNKHMRLFTEFQMTYKELIAFKFLKTSRDRNTPKERNTP